MGKTLLEPRSLKKCILLVEQTVSSAHIFMSLVEFLLVLSKIKLE